MLIQWLQTAFPANFDGDHCHDMMNNTDVDSNIDVANQLPVTSTTEHAGNDSFGINGEADWLYDDGSIDTTDNGLHWFWDSIWSDPFI